MFALAFSLLPFSHSILHTDNIHSFLFTRLPLRPIISRCYVRDDYLQALNVGYELKIRSLGKSKRAKPVSSLWQSNSHIMPFFTSPRSFHNANYMATSFSDLNIPGLTSQLALNRAQLSSATATPLPPHSSHPTLPHLTMLVFEAVLEVVCVSLPGYIIARQGMFTAEMQKFAANLNVAVFTPCLSTLQPPATQSQSNRCLSLHQASFSADDR